MSAKIVLIPDLCVCANLVNLCLTLFNIVETPFNKKLNLDVCVV